MSQQPNNFLVSLLETDEKSNKLSSSTTTVPNEQQTTSEHNEELFHNGESFEDLFNKLHVMKGKDKTLSQPHLLVTFSTEVFQMRMALE